jgi:hypothetical protein
VSVDDVLRVLRETDPQRAGEGHSRNGPAPSDVSGKRSDYGEPEVPSGIATRMHVTWARSLPPLMNCC